MELDPTLRILVKCRAVSGMCWRAEDQPDRYAVGSGADANQVSHRRSRAGLWPLPRAAVSPTTFLAVSTWMTRTANAQQNLTMVMDPTQKREIASAIEELRPRRR